MKGKCNLTVACRDHQVREIHATESPFVSLASLQGIYACGPSKALLLTWGCVYVINMLLEPKGDLQGSKRLLWPLQTRRKGVWPHLLGDSDSQLTGAPHIRYRGGQMLPWCLQSINSLRQVPWPDHHWKVRPSLMAYTLKTNGDRAVSGTRNWGPGLRDRLGSTLLAVQNTASIACVQCLWY